MSESGGLNIASTLGLDVSPFGAGMLQATAIAQVFPATVTNFLANPLLGLIGIASEAASAIKSAFLDVAHAADDAGESAAKLGVSVEFLTGMGRAAADAGSSMEGFGDALKFLNKNAADAGSGSASAVASFTAIGVSATDAAGHIKPTEELFREVADAIGKLDDPAKRTAAAMDLLGRGGSDMLAAIGGGAGGLQEMSDLFGRLGANIDDGLAQSGDKFGTLETIVGAAVDGMKNSLAAPILGAFEDNFDAIVEKIVAFSDQVRPALAAVGEAIGPLILPAISIFTQLASVVADGAAAAFRGLAPVLSGVMPLLQGLADLAQGVLVPAFQILEPLIRGVAEALNAVLQVAGPLLSMVGGLASFFTSPIAEAVNALTGSGAVATASGAGGAAGPASRSTTINIDSVNVPPVNINEASSSIAAKIAPALRAGFDRQQDQLDAAAGRAATQEGL
jgi:phage-related protein